MLRVYLSMLRAHKIKEICYTLELKINTSTNKIDFNIF